MPSPANATLPPFWRSSSTMRCLSAGRSSARKPSAPICMATRATASRRSPERISTSVTPSLCSSLTALAASGFILSSRNMDPRYVLSSATHISDPSPERSGNAMPSFFISNGDPTAAVKPFTLPVIPCGTVVTSEASGRQYFRRAASAQIALARGCDDSASTAAAIRSMRFPSSLFMSEIPDASVMPDT